MLRELNELALVDTASFTYDEGDDKQEIPPIVINTYTFASSKWTTAKHRFKIVDQTTITKNGEFIIDNDLTSNQRSGLAMLVTSIDGIADGNTREIIDKAIKSTNYDIADKLWIFLKKLESSGKKKGQAGADTLP